MRRFLTILVGMVLLASYSFSQNDLTNKMMMGYQGWFSCKNDGSGPNDWRHWFKSTSTPTAANLSVDMWPDMSEYTTSYTTSMTGTNNKVFSSNDATTVAKHFEWMKNYNIHGVYLQRFLNELTADSRFKTFKDKVTQNVIAAANTHGRKFVIMYDLTATSEANLYNYFVADFQHLKNDLAVFTKASYAKQEDRPVIALWGIGFADRGYTTTTVQKILDYLHNSNNGNFYIVGGVNRNWRTLDGDACTSSAWLNIYKKMDMISPWAVGSMNNNSDADNYVSRMTSDLSYCNTNGMDYMPVVFPGFSWSNRYPGEPFNQIKRNGGDFYWHQVYNALHISGMKFLYTAMFDEVDEGTAMFKMIDTKAKLPTEAQSKLLYLNIDGQTLPTDWYLRLADQAQKMLTNPAGYTSTIPISPGTNNASFISQANVPTTMTLGQTASVSVTMQNTGTTTWTSAGSYKLGSQNPQDNPNWGLNRVALSTTESIAPGASKTFTFTIKAPATAGTYNFQWKMVQDGVAWFGATSTNKQITVSGTGSTYPLTVTSGTGSGNYASGATVNIAANPPATGKVFNKWAINSGAPAIANIYNASTTLTMPNTAAAVTATYINYLDACNSTTNWSSANTLSVNTSDKKEGTGSLQCVGSGTDEFKKVFTAFNPGIPVANASLKFWYYVSDVSKLGTSNQVELGSGGKADYNEYNWSLTGLVSGWNRIDLKISSASVMGTPNLSAITWFRIYRAKTGSITVKIDAIEISGLTASSKSSGIDFENVEVNVNSEENEFSMYPNPVSTDGILTIDARNQDVMAVRIISMNGQLVYSKNFNGAKTLNIETSNVMQSGLYIISLTTRNGVINEKLIVK